MNDIGVQEYFIHQPEMKKPSEFRGWCRRASGEVIEIEPDEQGGLFSETLNCGFGGKMIRLHMLDCYVHIYLMIHQ